MSELNEDCGCGSTTNNIRDYEGYRAKTYDSDPLVGKRVSLIDGRSGKVDDSIRNSVGEVIGYVIEGDRGVYRVFKDKILGHIEESGGAMASLASTPGMGEIVPPTADKPGSGDQFPTLTAGTPAAKKKAKKKDKPTPNPIDTSLMDFKSFIDNSRSSQG